MATSVAEAEAHIATAQDRFRRGAIKLWTDLHTLPETNSLRNATTRMRKFRRFHHSPFHQVADVLKDVSMESLEIINPFTLAPWERRAQMIAYEAATDLPHTDAAVHIAVGSSARNGVVGVGGVV